MSAGFDRVRPRDPRPTGGTTGISHDPEGKRALFSAASPGDDRPGIGSVTIECSGCGERSIVSVTQAMRAAFPSLLLGLTVVHGESSHGIGLAGENEHRAWLRCPACRYRRWVKLSITL